MGQSFDFSKLTSDVSKAVGGTVYGAGEMAGKATDVVKKSASDVGEFVAQIPASVGQAAHDAPDSIKNAAGAVQTLAVSAGEMAKNQVNVLGDNLTGKVQQRKEEEYKRAITAYNAAYTEMNDKGLGLYRQRERSIDVLELIEFFINSIAHHPKSFDADLQTISIERKQFKQNEEYARAELEAARKSAAGAGTGVAVGAAAASLAPTAAIWIATTFGTASTGTAISTLSGAAASNAALAWLGGGALTAGGGGVAAGNALLALAGPVGWGIAGATLLTAIVLFAKAKHDNEEDRQNQLIAIINNTGETRQLGAQISVMLEKTDAMRQGLVEEYRSCLRLFAADFATLDTSDQLLLGSLVNNAKSLAVLLNLSLNQQLSIESSDVSDENHEDYE